MISVVMNLVRRPDRLQSFIQRNEDRKLPVEVVEAFDGQQLNLDVLVERGLVVSRNLGWSLGALGNALTHAHLWEACVREKQPFAVFEDDALMPRNITGILRDENWVDYQAADLCYLGYNLDAGLSISGSALNVGGWADVLFSEVPFAQRREALLADSAPFTSRYPARLVWGTLAYVVTPAGAERLLAACLPLCSPDYVRGIGGAQIMPVAIDGLLNVRAQQGRIRTEVCFPPLVVGPNDHDDSDIVGSA